MKQGNREERLAKSLFLVFLSFSTGAVSYLVSSLQTPVQQSQFICTAKGSLFYDQSASKFVGANSFGILSDYLGIGRVTGTQPSLERLTEAANCGLHIIRFWLDIAPGDYWFGRVYTKFNQSNDHHDYFDPLDHFISDANANSIRLVPVLASAYDQWTQTGAGDNFWQVGSRTNLVYKQWVAAIVQRYSNNTTVAWWEVANEPNYAATIGLSRANIPTVTTWGKDIYNYVRAIDHNHLVSGGFSNTGNLDLQEWGSLNEPFDISSMHIYEKDLYGLELGKLIFDHESAIRDFVQTYSDYSHKVLHKPLVFGEFNAGKLTRSPWFVERFLHYAVTGADGALIWSWEEGQSSDPYLVSPEQTPEVVNVLQQYTTRLSTN